MWRRRPGRRRIGPPAPQVPPSGRSDPDGRWNAGALTPAPRTAGRDPDSRAIRGDGPPGALVRLEGDDVAPAVETRLSVHQIGVADLLDGLRWTHTGPEKIVLLGLVPRTLELGVGGSSEVAEALDMLVETVAEEASRLGFPLIPRPPDDTVQGCEPDFIPRALGL